MTKEELIYITLKQLSENLKSSPENFKLEDSEISPTSGSFPGPTIIWQFKFKINEDQSIQDPLNATRTIIVTYNKLAKQLSCLIYFREVNTMSHAIMPETQAMFQCFDIPYFNRTFRKFMELREELVKSKREKEYLDYLKKLNNIFPSVHEEDLFK